MKHDEFAFFNQQLAAMLRDGIPLEGALKQLCAGMRTNPLRAELQELETDLSRGTPLPAAIGRRKLPPFYTRMVEIGARSNNLPGMLTLVADHYHRMNALWARLKGLLVYPVILIIVSLSLTVMLSLAFRRFLEHTVNTQMAVPQLYVTSMWIPPLTLGILAALGIATISIPSWRARFRWRIPALRDASLAELASSLALMLRSGATLPEALSMAEALESNGPAASIIAHWRELTASGAGRPTQWTASNKIFPPLFLWLVQQGGEDPASGFQKAADIYHARASYRTELFLYGALPVSILILGQMVLWQTAPMLRSMSWLMNTLGDAGGNM